MRVADSVEFKKNESGLERGRSLDRGCGLESGCGLEYGTTWVRAVWARTTTGAGLE